MLDWFFGLFKLAQWWFLSVAAVGAIALVIAIVGGRE
jgi:hypothetical protein